MSRNDFHNLEEGDDAEYFVFSIGCQAKPSSIARVALFNWNLRVLITSRLLECHALRMRAEVPWFEFAIGSAEKSKYFCLVNEAI